MTEDELDMLEKLYAGPMPLRQIATRLGYGVDTVQKELARDRDRFPYRHKRISRGERERWVARIRAGKATPRQAAKALGVSPVTISKWVRSWS